MSQSDRLDSWKEIAQYLRRGVRTAQRWEQEAALPIHRVSRDTGSVYAFRSEIDDWWQARSTAARPPDLPLLASATVLDGTAAAATAVRPATRVRPFLSQDVRVDPESAPGHAGMAIYFFTLTAMGLLPPAEGMTAARAAAARAVQLDPANPEGHALLGIVAALFDRRWDEAARSFERALARTPVPPNVSFHYSCWFLSPLGRHAESLAHLASAIIDDPLYLLGRAHIAMERCSLGRTADGMAGLQAVLKIDPAFGPALGLLGREWALAGRADDAFSMAERAHAAIPSHPNAVGFLTGMLRQAGRHAESARLLEALARDAAWSLPRAQAEAHIVCGEPDAAMACISEAVAARDPGVWLLFMGSAGALLRGTRGWRGVRAMLNLP